MQVVKKESTDQSGFAAVLYDIHTPDGIVKNLYLEELLFISRSLKLCISEIKKEETK